MTLKSLLKIFNISLAVVVLSGTVRANFQQDINVVTADQPKQAVDLKFSNEQQEQYNQLKTVIFEALKHDKKTFVQKLAAFCNSEWITLSTAFVMAFVMASQIGAISSLLSKIPFPKGKKQLAGGLFGVVSGLVIVCIFLISCIVMIASTVLIHKLFRLIAVHFEKRPKACLCALERITKGIQEKTIIVPEEIKAVSDQLPKNMTAAQAEKTIEMLLDFCNTHIFSTAPIQQ